VDITLNFSDSASQIAATMNLVLFGGTPIIGVTGTDTVPGTTNGDYLIDFGGPFTGFAVPQLFVKPDSVTGSLATTPLDDGSIFNGKRFGSFDPSISPIRDLGNGIVTASGIMSSGPTDGVNGRTGSANFVDDTQFLYLQYPSSAVTTFAPNFATDTLAQQILTILTGLSTSELTDDCSYAGMLVVLCNTDQGSIQPGALSALCGAFN
ncbi:MAG TPA: hypothetical protein VFR41_00930, partial [Acidimicrobiia bacterium]|nr:hypothetical protein [Acidimicrobiia bacterium]